MLGLLLGHLYVSPNSLWAPFVNVIEQFLYCLVLCSGFAGMHPTLFFFPHQDLHAKIATDCILFYCTLVNAIARPSISIFLNSICVYCCVLLDTTALLELETQAFHYTHNNIS